MGESSLQEELDEVEKELEKDSEVELSPEGNFYRRLARLAVKIARALLEY